MAGYTWNHEMRQKIALASAKYLADPDDRVAMNQIIQDIQKPVVEVQHQLEAENKRLKSRLQLLEKQAKVKA